MFDKSVGVVGAISVEVRVRATLSRTTDIVVIAKVRVVVVRFVT